MDVFEELKKFNDLVAYDKLIEIVNKPIYLCKQEIKNIIPSIELGSDGTVLSNIFLVTNNYIIDIRIQPQNELFDFVSLNTIKNYRFTLSEHVIKTADEKEILYEVANIVLIHDIAQGFTSVLNYVGHNRESWINLVIDSIPLGLLL